jgi:hypothetical protein
MESGTPLQKTCCCHGRRQHKNGGSVGGAGRHAGRLLACLACGWKNGTQDRGRGGAAAVLAAQRAPAQHAPPARHAAGTAGERRRRNSETARDNQIDLLSCWQSNRSKGSKLPPAAAPAQLHQHTAVPPHQGECCGVASCCAAAAAGSAAGAVAHAPSPQSDSRISAPRISLTCRSERQVGWRSATAALGSLLWAGRAVGSGTGSCHTWRCPAPARQQCSSGATRTGTGSATPLARRSHRRWR